MNKNIFVTFLELLKVRHTRSFSEKYFNEHPHKYNLYGLSSMLSFYGIENAALRIDDKQNNLATLIPPFIAYVGNELVIVNKNTSKKVEYIWKNKHISTSVDEFVNSWSGVVLLAEPCETSGEPKYRSHRETELYKSFVTYLLVFLCVLCIGMILVPQQLFYNWKFPLSFLINLVGISVCYLLILKQMKIQSSYIDNICSLFKQKDCNNILESNAAKLWGIIGWSEVGLGYFISNTIILLCFPHLVSFLAVLNIFALPYTIWSIQYQKKAKQWCPLCLIVQGLLWGIFAVNLFAGFIQIPLFNIIDLLWVGIIYAIPFLTISLVLPKLSEGVQAEDIKQQINSLKADETVFLTLLKKQPYHCVSKEDSTILFGDINSKKLITVLTNPHCTPCAKMHAEIEKLLTETKNGFCIQYILTSSNEEQESSNLFLIHVYHDYPNQALNIFNEWFSGGKYQKEKIFLKYNFNKNRCNEEYTFHKAWREKHKLFATPIVLINGYRLPENYKIEDLRYINEFNVNIE